MESFFGSPGDFDMRNEFNEVVRQNIVDPFRDFMDSIYNKRANQKISKFISGTGLQFMAPD